jgi:putative acetyltransferase
VNQNFTFCIATSDSQYHDAMLLFKEYTNSLNISLDFQHFDEELKIISKMYGDPDGQLIVVYDTDVPVACAALRKIGEGICEVKRMYVKPSHRKLGIADTMIEMLIEKAKSAKYKLMRLDTLDTMVPAITLYKKNGFYEIDAYYFNPNKNTVYMEKSLRD